MQIITKDIVLEGLKKGLNTSFPLALKECYKNKEQLKMASYYLTNKNVEGFNLNVMTYLPQAISNLIMLAVSLALFVWAIWALINYYQNMDTWAVIVAVLLLFIPSMGSLASLLLIYLNKKDVNSFGFYSLM